MASQDKRITADDIMKKFIVRTEYGKTQEEGGEYPSATVVFSTVTTYYKETSRANDRSEKIYENRPNHHAERYLCQDLQSKLRSEGDKVKKVVVTLVQNYSPCKDCAKYMVKLKKQCRKKGVELSLTIQFANFFRHYQDANKDGLIELRRKGVVLKLLEGKEAWDTFLNDTTFVNLRGSDKTDLLDKATSDERREREKRDKEILGNIEEKAQAERQSESESESGSEG